MGGRVYQPSNFYFSVGQDLFFFFCRTDFVGQELSLSDKRGIMSDKRYPKYELRMRGELLLRLKGLGADVVRGHLELLMPLSDKKVVSAPEKQGSSVPSWSKGSVREVVLDGSGEVPVVTHATTGREEDWTVQVVRAQMQNLAKEKMKGFVPMKPRTAEEKEEQLKLLKKVIGQL